MAALRGHYSSRESNPDLHTPVNVNIPDADGTLVNVNGLDVYGTLVSVNGPDVDGNWTNRTHNHSDLLHS